MTDTKHLLQSEYWEEIKSKLGNESYRLEGAFLQLTKMPIPFFNRYVGYLPRVDINEVNFKDLIDLAKNANCIFITVDPTNVKGELKPEDIKKFKKTTAIQLQKNIVIDLSKTEAELLLEMKSKHRYNIKVAEKHNVDVKISNTNEDFETFIKLYSNTKERHDYPGRSPKYVRTVWEVLKTHNKAYIATAFYNNKPIVSWFLVTYNNTIYYPYGGSDYEYRNVMGPFLLVWEIIKWGKSNGYKYFDLMGITNNIEEGFSRFKYGFTQNIIEYEDSFDIIIDPVFYRIFKFLEFLRNNFPFLKRFI